MGTKDDPRQALARRLRALREAHWPDLAITQPQLAAALGGLSPSLISSWESQTKPVTPPLSRLAAYATFFSTRRSCESSPYRVLPLADLTDNELNVQEGLYNELSELRKAVDPEPGSTLLPADHGGLWHFPDAETVTIVCAALPEKLRPQNALVDADSADYVALYTYADVDALIELHGHIRGANSAVRVKYKVASELTQDDFTTHLAVLGGTDWNSLTRAVLGRTELPLKTRKRTQQADIGGIEVDDQGKSRVFTPKLDNDRHLTEDVALFYRGENPFNPNRTVTICYGMYGRGTLGAVRALTDQTFRDGNETYIRERFDTSQAFCIISRVAVVNTQVVAPDWTRSDSRLYEWPKEDSGEQVDKRGSA